MSITWRIKVYDETFATRTQPGKVDNVLTPADAFASLDSFDVEGSGNCLEARFQCVPSLVDIRPRDVIELEVSEDSGSSYTRVYRGYIVVAGNPRGKEIEAYKAVGLKQRFYEKLNPLSRIDGDDIATMAADVHSELVTVSDLPAGVSTSAADAPTLSLVLGNRYPQFESVGVTYDALAEQAGAFVVPAGSSYTYDGVTYSPGDAVPPVQWGVDANGNFFFKRWQLSPVVAAELDDDKLVRYNEVVSEQVTDQVGVVYASQLELGPFENVRYFRLGTNPTADASAGEPPLGQPIVRTFSFGGDDATTLVPAASPQSLLTKISSYYAAGGSGIVTNPSNVDDGDVTTSAVITSGRVAVEADTGVYNAATDDGYIARLRFTTTNATNSVELRSQGAFFFTFDRQFEYTASNLQYPATFDLYVPFLRGVNTREFSGGTITYTEWPIGKYLVVEGANINVQLLEILVPDVDDGGTLSEEYAEIFVSQPTTNVAEVSQFGSLGSVSQTMTFTPSGESAVDVPVERVSYRLSTREGLVTTYHLGQAYDAELLSERAVLEALAARSAR